MYVIKPVCIKDLEAIYQCAQKASLGLTHLPKNRDALEEKILKSEKAFNSQIPHPVNEMYLFVLMDDQTGEIFGTSGIMSRTNATSPLHVFHIQELPSLPELLPSPLERRLLTLKQYKECPSEVGALYTVPEIRQKGMGKLISLSRFLFIACFPERFTDNIIANMRGFVDDTISPFWEGLGRHFLDLPLEEVFKKRVENEKFLDVILPKHPIYACLLKKEARDVIGHVHPNTAPALKMLLNQGFEKSNDIDPFDGGPILHAHKNSIKSVRESLVYPIKVVSKLNTPAASSKKLLICNLCLNFRACYTTAANNPHEELPVDEEVANALQVRDGDLVRIITL